MAKGPTNQKERENRETGRRRDQRKGNKDKIAKVVARRPAQDPLLRTQSYTAPTRSRRDPSLISSGFGAVPSRVFKHNMIVFGVDNIDVLIC
ncbi:unnamed protein product [Bursaphelenchus okinawaensis]|uniref:Uncharacterized protein n=1 Tax=Bursaphelenchus okinawaensis TaxID=465554 RepID=A0A811JQV7_9BILA|nr:unnamed protein product [Bursaphelenchus okinawaensis]CAG9078773.1 unnamed protein product [Bursaphelenchus okinawaensis]